MSQDGFNEFVSKLNSDATLRAALEQRFGDPGTAIPANDVISFASEQGYDFSVEDAAGELSDTALEGVAGGVLYHKLEYDYLKLDIYSAPSLTGSMDYFLKFS